MTDIRTTITATDNETPPMARVPHLVLSTIAQITMAGGINNLGTTIGPLLVSIAIFGSVAAGGNEGDEIWQALNDAFDAEIPGVLLRAFEARWPTDRKSVV